MELVYGIKIVVSGDELTPGAGSNIFIMNHRTRLDWLFFWPALWRFSYQNLVRQKITLKYPIKFFPIIGRSADLFLMPVLFLVLSPNGLSLI